MSNNPLLIRKYPGFTLKVVELFFSMDSDTNPLNNPANQDLAVSAEASLQLYLAELKKRTSSKLQSATGAPVYLGIDSEYQLDTDNPNSNVVLSYQGCLFTELGVLKVIVYPCTSNRNDRVYFDTFTRTNLLIAKEFGLLHAWPSVINVCAHFMRADITHFGGFWRDKRQVDSLRGTVTSLSSNYGPAQDDAVKLQPLVVGDEDWYTARLKVKLVDTFLISPGSQGLEALGELIGFKKLSLPDGYSKEKMADFMRDHPDLFEEYAVRDAEIAVRYALKMKAFAYDEIGLKSIPPTIGSMAVSLFQRLYTMEA